MGSIVSSALFPAPNPPTYTLKSIPSPPLYKIHGVPCLYFQVRQHRGVILYLHCNGVDLGQIRNPLFMMARDTQFSVMAVEYPGYGAFKGSPSPDGCVDAAQKVLMYLREQAPNAPVIVVGRSIGTGVACQLAEKCGTALSGLVLISPFRSIGHVAEPVVSSLKVVVEDIFHSERALARFNKPTLIIHGARDQLIPLEHGKTLLEVLPASKKHLEILPESGHNDLDWTAIIRAINAFFPSP
jgi:pimeloyl-ACP methyl ester carboxylesterase